MLEVFTTIFSNYQALEKLLSLKTAFNGVMAVIKFALNKLVHEYAQGKIVVLFCDYKSANKTICNDIMIDSIELIDYRKRLMIRITCCFPIVIQVV